MSHQRGRELARRRREKDRDNFRRREIQTRRGHWNDIGPYNLKGKKVSQETEGRPSSPLRALGGLIAMMRRRRE